MTKTITQQLNEMFQTASLNHVYKILSPLDMLALADIDRSAAEKCDHLNALYDEEYNDRVNAECQKLYSETAQVSFDHPAPPGVSTTDTDTITLQAHRRVRLAHDADLQRVADNATREIEDLLERAEKRNQMDGVSKEDFTNASERRSGHDRRTLNQSQD
mgnify:CR=1 FL=1